MSNWVSIRKLRTRKKRSGKKTWLIWTKETITSKSRSTMLIQRDRRPRTIIRSSLRRICWKKSFCPYRVISIRIRMISMRNEIRLLRAERDWLIGASLSIMSIEAGVWSHSATSSSVSSISQGANRECVIRRSKLTSFGKSVSSLPKSAKDLMPKWWSISKRTWKI